MKKIIKYIIVSLTSLLLIWSIFFIIGKAGKKQEYFEIKKPFISNLTLKTVATGSVIPRKEVSIKPQVSGIVSKIYVKAGDMVKNGDLLAKIRIIPNLENLNNAESRVGIARINLDDATKDYNRQKGLYDREIISKSEYQKILKTLNSAKEELESAQNNLQLIKDGTTPAFSSTTNTLVRATVNGMVLDMPVREGVNVIQANTFNDGTTMAVIADMGDMIFKGTIDESEIGRIHPGMKLEIHIGAYEEKKFPAVLTYISPKSVVENGFVQFEIMANIDISDNNFIRAGLSANADIILAQVDSVLVIDENLVHFSNDSAYVEVLQNKGPNQVFEKRNIKLGLSDGVNIQAIEGINLNDLLKGNKIYNSK